MTMSLWRTSSFASSSPRGVARFRRTLLRLKLRALKTAPRLMPGMPSAPVPRFWRWKSRRLCDSTRITSAPRLPSQAVA